MEFSKIGKRDVTFIRQMRVLILVGLIVLCVNVNLTELLYVSKINNSTKLCMRVV